MVSTQERWGFTPGPDCNCCGGSGYFAYDPDCPDNDEPCAFCLEDAIIRGEIQGTVHCPQCRQDFQPDAATVVADGWAYCSAHCLQLRKGA